MKTTGMKISRYGMMMYILLPLLCLSFNLFAQEARVITGTVIDSADKAPLHGVSIQVRNSAGGTTTNENGEFTLSVTSNEPLVISFVGYKTIQLMPNFSGKMSIVLTVQAAIDNEVVVIGYGSARKKDLTGSIVSVKPDKLAQENPNTVQDVLRGTPGVFVGYDPSAKGGGSIQIRGQRSVYTAGGHNDPLLVLDGMFFYGELSEINPDDIAQIDVLKDASAAAIYGARAANGVLIITTKKGKVGKPVVNVTTNIGTTTRSDYREVFGPESYMNYRENWYKKDTYGVNGTTGNYEAYRTGNAPIGFYDKPENISQYGITIDQWRAYSSNTTGESDKSIYARRLGLDGGVLANYLADKTYDWYDHTFRNGINQDYNASISGASETMNYYFSMGYLRNEGAVDYNNYSAMRSNVKIAGKVTKWFDLGVNVNFQDRSDGDLQPGLGLNYWDANQIRNSPYSNYLDADGNMVQFPMDEPLRRGVNYDFDKQYLALERGYTVLNSILTAKIKLPFKINYAFNFSPRYQWYYNRYFMSAELPGSDPISRGVDRNSAKRYDYSLNNTLSWEHTFADKHRFSLTAVQEAEDRRYWSDGVAARYILPSDALGFHNTQNATVANSSFSTDDTHQSADGLMGRLFYAYDNKYMLTATVRRDGYSAFGQNNPYATFPSIAFAWSFIDEKFMQRQDFLSTGKLRLSWGKNGNRSLADPYVSLSNLTSGLGATMGYILANGNMNEVRYLFADRLANPNLQWEKSSATNIGLDYGFFNDRISGSIDVYSILTHDMIMQQRIPDFTGFTSIVTNLGEVQNTGIDFFISTANFQKKDFKWNTSLSFSLVKNRINSIYGQYVDVFDNNGNHIGTKEPDDITNGWFIGKPISAIWDYKVTGIWQNDEVAEAKRYGQKPGDPKVANNYTADDRVNADGSITPIYNNNDREFLGQAAPPINWQLRNDFTFFNNITFSFNIYSYMGHKSLASEYRNNDNGGSLITYGFNTFSKAYWTPENATNTYARLDAAAPSGAGAAMLYDRSFIRLENISIGYSFPKKLISRFDMTNLKFFGSIRNAGVWNKNWEYGDPETSGLATRVYSMGLNVTF